MTCECRDCGQRWDVWNSDYPDATYTTCPACGSEDPLVLTQCEKCDVYLIDTELQGGFRVNDCVLCDRCTPVSVKEELRREVLAA